jgi:phage gpG-like protein
MRLDITVQGDDVVERHLARFAENAENPKRVFRETAVAIAAANERSWGRGVKLAESTLAQKRGGEPLVDTGALKRSLTVPGHVEGGIRRITAQEMEFGTSLFYARFVQHGFTHKGGERIPPRKVLKVTPKVKKTVKELLYRHLMSGLGS